MKWYQHIFGDADARAKYNEAKKRSKEDRKLASDPYAIKTLSEEEILRRLNRIKLEQSYRDLVIKNTTAITRGERKLNDKSMKTLYKQEVKKMVAQKAAENTVNSELIKKLMKSQMKSAKKDAKTDEKIEKKFKKIYKNDPSKAYDAGVKLRKKVEAYVTSRKKGT